MPAKYSAWNHLKSVMIPAHNRYVREVFGEEDVSWSETGLTREASLKIACMAQVTDTVNVLVVRLILFYIILGKKNGDGQAWYGIPVSSFQETRKFKPQITLVFYEDSSDIEPGYTPVTGEVSFRLMDETSDTITEAKALHLANRVKTSFGQADGFIWRKGKTMCSYSDWEKGYSLQLRCRNEAEGRRLVEQVLDVQSHTPDWSKFNIKENANPATAYPTVPGQKTIMGQSRKIPRRRPIADCRFKYAKLDVHGIAEPITLFDLSNTRRKPLVK